MLTRRGSDVAGIGSILEPMARAWLLRTVPEVGLIVGVHSQLLLR